MKTDIIKLDERLKAVASFVRQDTVLYDVGSDHAYLPSHLISENRISFAYVCDIADGPLKRAYQTVISVGVQNKTKICKADGLKGIEITYPCDVSVAGMGGELICEIIDAKPELKNSQVRLILQPMTKHEILRKYLAENGFRFENELTVFEGKYYTVMVCSYDGVKRDLSPLEQLFGIDGIRSDDRVFEESVRNKLTTLKAISNGKKSGGADTSFEDEIIKQTEKMLNERGI